MAVRAKRFEYRVGIAADGTALAEGGSPVAPAEAWTPEHLVLAGLARCTLASLRHECGRLGVEMSGAADAEGAVSRRESDGRFALVEVRVSLTITLDPAPAPDALGLLLWRAQRGCFVGASLTAPVEYEWLVNGAAAAPQAPESASQA